MAVYNTKDNYLKEAISSVFELNYDNYEFIIIDDGSNLQTKNILKEYENNCTVIHQENKGISASRLLGLKQAKGDYIVFLDSDDHIDKEGLNVLNEIILKNNPDVVMYDPPRYLDDYTKTEFRNKFFEEGIIEKDEVLKQLCLLHINCIGDKFVKREFYNDMEKEIDTSFIVGEDVQQSTYIVLKANTFYYTDYPIEYYRLNLIKREYYNAKYINDINFPIPPYKMLFEKNTSYRYLLPFFKKAVTNSVIYSSFKVCKTKATFKEKKEILNNINELEIIKVLLSIKEKTPIITTILFYLLVKKHYFLLYIAATIYNMIFKLDNLY